MNSSQIAIMLLVTVGPCLLVTIYLGLVLIFRLQIHIFELMVTLLASSLPLGAILSFMSSGGRYHDSEDWAKAVAVGSFPMVLIFAGSVWGMSAIKRLEIVRPWRRIGVLVSGWGLVASILAVLPALVGLVQCGTLLYKGAYYRGEFSDHFVSLIIALGVVALGVPGFILERKCGRHRQELQRLENLRVREKLRAEREAQQNKNA